MASGPGKNLGHPVFNQALTKMTVSLSKPKLHKSMELTAYCKALLKRGSLPTKVQRVMRLTAILMITATLHVSANSFSQNVTISSRKITLENAFKLIEEQTSFSFLWNENVLDKSHTISIEVKDAPLAQVLDICLRGLPLSYKIKN